MNLADVQILVTGGANGLGRHLAQSLGGIVRSLAVVDKDTAAMGELAASHPAIKCYRCDVTDPAAIAETVATLEHDGWAIDVLINNAGLIYSAPLVNLLEKNNRVHSADAWQHVLAANLSSVFHVTGHVVDQMLKRRSKGVVINVSSISARGNPGQSAYSAAKAGVNALTRAWAKELGAFGIRFVAIAPGFLDTASTHKALSEPILARIKEQIPLRRLGDAECIVQTVRFIIENDYVNGAVLDIDGGLVV